MYNQLVEGAWSIYQLEFKMNADTKYLCKDYYFNTIINVYNSIVKHILVTVVSDNSNRGIYPLKTNTKLFLRTY